MPCSKLLFKALGYGILLLSSFAAFAQKEANIWYFGEEAGLDFNSGNPIVITNSVMNTWEGCASVADKNGDLLFYTNGTFVYNRNHVLMKGGRGLHGNSSSSQSAVVIPKPGSKTNYYVFTVDELGDENGLKYSEVDMRLDGGLGEVFSKNKQLVKHTNEKLTVIKHQNNKDFWVLTHLHNSRIFHTYLVSENGVDSVPVITETGAFVTNVDIGGKAIGCMRANAQGNMVAIAHGRQDTVELLDFDNSSGKLSNVRSFNNFINNSRFGSGPYSAEFSTSGRYLYVSDHSNTLSHVYQYDLSNTETEKIRDSRKTLGSFEGTYGTLQMAPDGKIYLARYYEPYLGVINNPEGQGNEANFLDSAIFLEGNQSTFGLPLFMNNMFLTEPSIISDANCEDDIASFSYSAPNWIDSAFWLIESPSGKTKKVDNPAHPIELNEIGEYTTRLISFFGSNMDTTTFVHSKKQLTATFLDTLPCENESLKLNARLDAETYSWKGGEKVSSLSITVPGNYWVKMKQENCTFIDTINVVASDCQTILKMPNIFTPNGDGYNDVFKPITSRGIESMVTRVYNRWGKLVHESDNLGIEWNATENTPGIYFWTVEYIDITGKSAIQKGNLTLIR